MVHPFRFDEAEDACLRTPTNAEQHDVLPMTSCSNSEHERDDAVRYCPEIATGSQLFPELSDMPSLFGFMEVEGLKCEEQMDTDTKKTTTTEDQEERDVLLRRQLWTDSLRCSVYRIKGWFDKVCKMLSVQSPSELQMVSVFYFADQVWPIAILHTLRNDFGWQLGPNYKRKQVFNDQPPDVLLVFSPYHILNRVNDIRLTGNHERFTAALVAFLFVIHWLEPVLSKRTQKDQKSMSQ